MNIAYIIYDEIRQQAEARFDDTAYPVINGGAGDVASTKMTLASHIAESVIRELIADAVQQHLLRWDSAESYINHPRIHFSNDEQEDAVIKERLLADLPTLKAHPEAYGEHGWELYMHQHLDTHEEAEPISM